MGKELSQTQLQWKVASWGISPQITEAIPLLGITQDNDRGQPQAELLFIRAKEGKARGWGINSDSSPRWSPIQTSPDPWPCERDAGSTGAPVGGRLLGWGLVPLPSVSLCLSEMVPSRLGCLPGTSLNSMTKPLWLLLEVACGGREPGAEVDSRLGLGASGLRPEGQEQRRRQCVPARATGRGGLGSVP